MLLLFIGVLTPIAPPEPITERGSPAAQTTHQTMNSRFTCPHCSSVLLRHVRAEGVYWWCKRCHQPMPVGRFGDS